MYGSRNTKSFEPMFQPDIGLDSEIGNVLCDKDFTACDDQGEGFFDRLGWYFDTINVKKTTMFFQM